jgi:hypothetical protein
MWKVEHFDSAVSASGRLKKTPKRRDSPMTLTLEMLLALVAGLLTILGFWTGVIRWVTAEMVKRDVWMSSELGKRDLRAEAETARAKMAEDDIRQSLNGHKLYVAENYTTSSEFNAALGELRATIGKLDDKLDQLLSRP